MAIIVLCLLSALSAILFAVLRALALYSGSPTFDQYFGGIAWLDWSFTWLIIGLLLTAAVLLLLKRRQALWFFTALLFLAGADVLQRLLTRDLRGLGINFGLLGIIVMMFGVGIELVGSIVILAYVWGLYSRDELS